MQARGRVSLGFGAETTIVRRSSHGSVALDPSRAETTGVTLSTGAIEGRLRPIRASPASVFAPGARAEGNEAKRKRGATRPTSGPPPSPEGARAHIHRDHGLRPRPRGSPRPGRCLELINNRVPERWCLPSSSPSRPRGLASPQCGDVSSRGQSPAYRRHPDQRHSADQSAGAPGTTGPAPSPRVGPKSAQNPPQWGNPGDRLARVMST